MSEDDALVLRWQEYSRFRNLFLEESFCEKNPPRNIGSSSAVFRRESTFSDLTLVVDGAQVRT